MERRKMGKARNFNRDYYTRQALSHSGITNAASREQQWLREEASRHHGKREHLEAPPLLLPVQSPIEPSN